MPTTQQVALLCTSRSWGGLEMNVAKLANWLPSLGWQIQTIGSVGAPLGSTVQANGGRFEAIKRRLKYFDFHAAWQLARVLRTSVCRLLVIKTTHDMNTAALAKRLFLPSLQLVYWQQMQLGADKRGPVHRFQFASLDAWIAPMPWLADQVASRTTMDPSKVHLIPLGVDSPALAAGMPATKAEARNQLDVPQDATICGILGRLDPGKGQAVLLEALALIKDEVPRLHMLIQGDETIAGKTNTYSLELRRLVAAHGLTERVHFRPARPDVATSYRAMDAFAMCSSGETYGVVTIEAMACGVPVLATHAGSNPDLLQQGALGTLFEVGSSKALAEALRAFCTDAGAFKAKAELAKVAAFGPYSKAAMLAQMDQLFRTLLSS